MNARVMALIGVLLLATSSAGLAQLNSAQDVRNALEQEGYKDVTDINFGAEAITAKANKDGKEWLLVVDSSGHVIQQEASK